METFFSAFFPHKNPRIPRMGVPDFFQNPHRLRVQPYQPAQEPAKVWMAPYQPLQEPAKVWMAPYQPPAETANLDQIFNDIINENIAPEALAPKPRVVLKIKINKPYQPPVIEPPIRPISANTTTVHAAPVSSTTVRTTTANAATIHTRAVETLQLPQAPEALPEPQAQNAAAAPDTDPVEASNLNDTVDSVSKKALKESQGNSGPPPLPPYITVLQNMYKGALAAIPLLILALYTSKEELLQNINVNIKASSTPKVYQIGLGSEGNAECSLSFEVENGKRIRFLHNRNAEMSTSCPQPIFLPTSSLMVSLLGPVKHLIWKRQEPYTNCNIVIEDKGNPALQEGPLATYVKASEKEGFYLVHVDPTVTPDTSSASDFVLKAEGTQWASFKAVSVTVSDPITPNDEHRRQVIPLPFTENGRQYLSITQYM